MSTEITIQQDQIDINVDTTTIVIESPQGGYPLPSSVYSVFGRVGNVVAEDGDYNLTQLGDVTITNPLTGQALVYNGTTWVNNTETYVGTVTSVNMSVPTGLTISGNPITTAGTLALGLASGYSIPTTASQSTWDTAYNERISTATAPLSISAHDISISQSSASANGYLSSTDWATFNAKQSALSGTGIVKSTAGTISYLTDNTSNWDTAYSRSLTSASVTGTTTKTLTLNEQGGGTITATWSDYDTAPVTSVFGRTGAITAQSGDYTTTLVTEGTNLYYTQARFNSAFAAKTTTDLDEGTNLYYTQTRFNTAFAAKSTTDLAEGTNLYFTTARAQAAISGTSPISVASGVVSISQANTSTSGYLSSTDWNNFNAKQAALTLGNLTSSDISVSGGTGAVVGSGTSMTLATVNSNVGAYGDSTNVPTITVNAKGLVTAASQTAIPTSSGSTTGLLTSSDWTTFNQKQAQLNGTGFVKASGTTITYDNSTYLTTIDGIAAGGELSGTYANPSLVNSAVTGKVLTGVNITGGTIQATDSILTAFGKVQNQINGLIGGSIYKGTWNASTNTPALASGVGTTGWYYIVNVAGTTNLDGITDWNVGDWAIFDGTAWQQVDNTDAVVSVNGFTGAVSLTTSNISEGSNLYYTDARARGAISGGTGISYNSTSGVITNSAPDQTVSLTGAGTTSISGSYPNFTITSNDQYVGTVTSVGITESSAALSITGSPVTTSGNINIAFAGTSSQYVAGDGSLVTFPTIGQASKLITEVYNETGATLTKGTVVYINGGHGNLPTITKALATSDATSAQTYGVVQGDITDNTNGFVVVIGSLTDLDTQAYSNGTQLYLSSTVAGEWTSTKQYAPAHLVYVGIVTRSHPTQGVVEVKVQNGYELDELHNVAAQTPSNNDGLFYESSTSLWKNKSISTVLGYTPEQPLTFSSPLSRSVNTVSIPAATTSTNGYLTNTDWNTFNNKQSALTIGNLTEATSSVLTITGGTGSVIGSGTSIQVKQATTSQSGFLSSTDWNTFNGKQGAITLTTTGSSGAATFVGGTLNIPNYGSALSGYLPLTGGTLTGALNGTSATFSGDLTLDNGSADGGQLILKSLGFSDWNIDNYSGTLRAYYGATTRFSLTNAGAATFSSSVTADGVYVTNGNPLRVYNTGNGDYGNLTFATATGFTFDKGARFAAAVTIANNSNLFLTNTKLGGDTNYNFDINYNTGGTPLLTWYGGSTTSRFSVKTNGSISVGTTGKTWETAYRSLDIGNGWGIMAQNANSDGYLCSNAYYNGQWRVSAQTGVKPTVMRIYDGLTLECGTTGSVDSVTTLTNLFTITSGGNVLIGTTTDSGYALNIVQSANSALLGLSNGGRYTEIDIKNSGTNKVELYWDNTTGRWYNHLNAGTGAYLQGGAWTSESDERLKDIIEPISNAIDKVNLLNGVIGKYKYEEEGTRRPFLIAQDVKKALPEAVSLSTINKNSDEEYLHVAYTQIIPLLVEAIKEQNQLIDGLNQRLNALENK